MGEAPLLTHGDQTAKLEALFGARLPHRGKLQIPTGLSYNTLTDDEGLKQLAHEMFRWLGIKPGRLNVSFGAIPNQWQTSVDKHTITIQRHYRSHPYAAAALLALATMAYCIERYDKTRPSSLFVEFASIELGLGIWVINGLRPQCSRWQTIYHAVDGAWFRREGIQLASYTTRQYASAVAAYAHRNRLAPETYLAGVAQPTRYLLPDFVTTASDRSLPTPQQVAIHIRRARQMWVKITLLVLIVSGGFTIGAYVLGQRQPTKSPEQIEAEQALQITKRSLDSCVQKASDEQSTYDPNDLFMTRQVDATKSRCESLRNEYNYALDQYQTTYPDR